MAAAVALLYNSEEVPPLTFKDRCAVAGLLLVALFFCVLILPGCCLFWLAEVSERGIDHIRPAQHSWQAYRTTCVTQGRMSNPLVYLWIQLCGAVLVALFRLCYITTSALAHVSFIPLMGVVETVDALKGGNDREITQLLP